jgi:hypothetical protein
MNMSLTERDTLPRHVKSFFYLKNHDKALDVFLRFLRPETHNEEIKKRLHLFSEMVLAFGMSLRDDGRRNANSSEWCHQLTYPAFKSHYEWMERRSTPGTSSPLHKMMIEYFSYLSLNSDGTQREEEKVMEYHNYLTSLVSDALHQIEFLEGLGFDVVHSPVDLSLVSINKETIPSSVNDSADVYFVYSSPAAPDVKEVVKTLHRAEADLVVVSDHWSISQWRRKCCPSKDDLYKMIGKIAPDEHGHRTLMFV